MHHTQEKIILKNQSKLRLVVSGVTLTNHLATRGFRLTCPSRPIIYWLLVRRLHICVSALFENSGCCISNYRDQTWLSLLLSILRSYFGHCFNFFLLFYCPSSYFVLCFYLDDSHRLLSRWTWLGPVKFWVIVCVTLWCQVIAYSVTSISYNRN